MASTWDLFRGDTSGWADRFFFLDMIEQYGQPVLDVGCGTGRLLIDYLAAGVQVEGVDASPEMLTLCRQKAQQAGLEPVLYEQEMETLDLPGRYRTILVPSSSFQLLTDLEAARRAIGRFFAHLESGGALVMPFMLIHKTGDPLHTTWEVTGEKVRPEDGALVRRWSRADYDLEQQLESTEDRYEVIRDGELVSFEHHRRSPATRWYTQEDALRLYREAGFVHLQVYKEFTRQPADPDDPVFNVVGLRP
jgi:ubiquinone/menaquinone biosynthesis C-methylase UbiE